MRQHKPERSKAFFSNFFSAAVPMPRKGRRDDPPGTPGNASNRTSVGDGARSLFIDSCSAPSRRGSPLSWQTQFRGRYPRPHGLRRGDPADPHQHQTDLIGGGSDALIAAQPPREAPKARMERANDVVRGDHVHTIAGRGRRRDTGRGGRRRGGTTEGEVWIGTRRLSARLRNRCMWLRWTSCPAVA